MIFDECSVRWFAVQVKSRSEFLVSSLLNNKGYEIYTPRYHVQSGRVHVARKSNLALLPGYIFCRFDSTLKAPILTTPGVIRIVGFGRTPIPVSREELEGVRRAERGGSDVCPHPFLTAGQRVRVEEGPLAGVEGIVMAMRGIDRLVVSVNLIQRSVSVELHGYRVRSI